MIKETVLISHILIVTFSFPGDVYNEDLQFYQYVAPSKAVCEHMIPLAEQKIIEMGQYLIHVDCYEFYQEVEK